jgi:membrane protease YdiL (CAAX protease family)
MQPSDASPGPSASARPVIAGSPVLLIAAAWLCWRAGAAAASQFGVWPGIGTAASLAGVLAVALRGRDLLPLLRVTARDVALGVLAGAVMIVATYLLYEPAQALPFGIRPGTELMYQRFRDAPLALIAVLMPVCVVSEELVWRGLGQGALESRLGPWWAALVTAVIYGSAHFGAGLPLLPYLAGVCGLYWGLLRAATGSLTAPLIAHITWDVTVLILFPLVRT